jgi:hypothetical protein
LSPSHRCSSKRTGRCTKGTLLAADAHQGRPWAPLMTFDS